jgi:hypothetical protein
MDPELYYRYYGKNPSYAPDHFAIGGFIAGGFIAGGFTHAVPTHAVGDTESIPLDDLRTNEQPAVVIGNSMPEAHRNASTVSRDLERLFSQTYADVGGFNSDDLSGDLSGDLSNDACDAEDFGSVSEYIQNSRPFCDGGNYLEGNADNANDVDDVCACGHSQEDGSTDSIEFAAIGADESIDTIEDVSEIPQTEYKSASYSSDSLVGLFDNMPLNDDGGLGSTSGLSILPDVSEYRRPPDNQLNPVRWGTSEDLNVSRDESSDKLSDLLTD